MASFVLCICDVRFPRKELSIYHCVHPTGEEERFPGEAAEGMQGLKRRRIVKSKRSKLEESFPGYLQVGSSIAIGPGVFEIQC